LEDTGSDGLGSRAVGSSGSERHRSTDTDLLSVLFLAIGSGSEGRGEMGEILTGELGFRRGNPARACRGRTPASFQRVLDGGDAMTGIRTTRQARERESPPRSLLDEGVEDGWRGFGRRCAMGRRRGA
jgi:hypothetical protein